MADSHADFVDQRREVPDFKMSLGIVGFSELANRRGQYAAADHGEIGADLILSRSNLTRL